MMGEERLGAAIADQAKSISLARLLASEIAVSTVINIAFNFFFAWLVLSGAASIGRDAVMLDVLPATFVPALAMTFPITFLMRSRIRNGLTVSPAKRLPVVLPQSLFPRALVIALTALLLVALPVILLLWISWTRDWSWGELLAFKLAFSLFHAALITPIVVLTALSQDRN